MSMSKKSKCVPFLYNIYILNMLIYCKKRLQNLLKRNIISLKENKRRDLGEWHDIHKKNKEKDKIAYSSIDQGVCYQPK